MCFCEGWMSYFGSVNGNQIHGWEEIFSETLSYKSVQYRFLFENVWIKILDWECLNGFGEKFLRLASKNLIYSVNFLMFKYSSNISRNSSHVDQTYFCKKSWGKIRIFIFLFQVFFILNP